MNGNFPIASNHTDTARQPEPTVTSLLRYHRRIHLQIYVGWALANLVIGGILMFFTSGYWHHFHHMNAAWGSINLVIAGILWRKFRRQQIDAITILEQQFRRFLYINLCLDVLYIVTGVWLCSYGAESVQLSVLLRGFGDAIILQGSVLLALDASSLSLWVWRRKRT